MEVITDLVEFYCCLKCTDCTTLVSLVTLVTFILLDDLTKRTVRFGGDFSTASLHILIFPDALKQGACAQNGGKHSSMMLVAPICIFGGE